MPNREVVMVNQARQKGSVLLISLMLLIVVTLLAFAASESVLQQEKMTNSSKESDLAMQVAELAMMDAQTALAGMTLATFNSGFSLKGDSTGTKGYYDGSTCTAADANCYVNKLQDPFANTTWANAITTASSISCGTADTTCVLNGQYLVIKLAQIVVTNTGNNEVGSSDSSTSGAPPAVPGITWVYKIMARGQGNNGQNARVLSSYYIQSEPN